MKPAFSAVLLVAFLLPAAEALARGPLPTTAPEKVGLSAERLARIDKYFQGEVEKGRLPGGVVMIARRGELAYAKTFGFRDKGANAPMADDAIFRIYSMTKPFTSVAAMILVEDGRLQLTDPVSKHLPELAGPSVSVARTDAYGKVTYVNVPAERAITVQDLLRHTAGLAYGELTANAAVKQAYTDAGLYKPGQIDYDARDVAPADQVAKLARAPLVHQPGTAWEYSFATDALGRVVEAASGMRLGDFLEQRVFDPLGMSDTAFAVPAEKLPRLAEALPTDPATGAPNKLIAVAELPKNDSGGAGAVSTAGDYLRFTQMLLNGGELDGVRILSPTTVKLMTADHLGTRIATPVEPGELLIGTPGYTFGLGFAVRKGDGVAGVPGSAGEYMWGGYGGTYFWIDPQQKLTAVLMTQAPGPSRGFYRRQIKQLVYQAIVD